MTFELMVCIIMYILDACWLVRFLGKLNVFLTYQMFFQVMVM